MNQTVETNDPQEPPKEENVEIKIDGGNKTVTEGDSDLTLSAMVTPSSATKTVTWLTDNPSVAQIISTEGLKTTIKIGQAGTAHITCTHNNSGVKDVCTLTVKAKNTDKPSGGSGGPSGGGGSTTPNQPEPEPENITVKSVSINLPEGSNNSIKVGDSIQLKAEIEPQNATNQEVTWTSSTPKVATVSDTGLVKALDTGTTIITVETKDGNKKAQIKITVEKEETIEPDTPVSPDKPDDPVTPNKPDGSDIPETNQPEELSSILIYRLYNPNSGEHLFTSDKNEYDTLGNNNWNQEGTAWNSPTSGDPVYRLYSPVTGAHLYTKDENELNTLIANGNWTADNNKEPLMYSSGSKNVYRLYHEGIRMHLLTTDLNEYNILGATGWNKEGVKLNCL